MKNTIAFFAVALLISACSNAIVRKDVSPAFDYTDSNGKKHFVTGEIIKTYDQGLVTVTRTLKLMVSIDGEAAISGFLDGSNFNGTIAGKYDGKPAVASCVGVPRSADWTDVTCEVAFEGQRAGALKF